MSLKIIHLVISMIFIGCSSNLIITDQSFIVCSNINSESGCSNATINCPIGKQCIIDCNSGCINVVIDAELSSYLTILNCNDIYNINYCTNMIIYAPRNGGTTSRDLSVFNGNGSIKNSLIYTEAAFNDFSISKQLIMINTEIYCGKTAREHSCESKSDGLSCSIDSKDKTCDNLIIQTNINQTVAIIENDVSVTTSPDDYTMSVFGVIMWCLVFCFIALFCFYWVRQEIYHKNRPKSKSPVLSHPLLSKSRNTYTESLSSVDAGTSYSCNTMVFKSANITPMTGSLMGVPIAQSLPILNIDNFGDESDINMIYDHINDGHDDIDLGYPDSDNDVLGCSDDNHFKKTMSYNETNEFIVVADDTDTEY